MIEETNDLSNKLRKSLNKGEIVILDKDFVNSSEVRVIKQTAMRLFTTISSDGVVMWDVMTYRLTPTK